MKALEGIMKLLKGRIKALKTFKGRRKVNGSILLP
jgi:hypothetical protein